jgi:hypothetical protein
MRFRLSSCPEIFADAPMVNAASDNKFRQPMTARIDRKLTLHKVENLLGKSLVAPQKADTFFAPLNHVKYWMILNPPVNPSEDPESSRKKNIEFIHFTATVCDNNLAKNGLK